MAWESRQRGGRYYYRSKWVDGRPVKEYVGAGLSAQLSAESDRITREQREVEALREKQERERVGRSVAFLRELEEAAKILTTAHLIAAGYHKHNGEWRRLRVRTA
jgi:hypothetical protein